MVWRAHARMPVRALTQSTARRSPAPDAAPDTPFVIPEEPVAVQQADAASAAEARERAQRAHEEADPEGALGASERLVRRMRRSTLSHMAPLASTQTRDSSFRPFKLRTQPVEPHRLTLSHLLAATAQLGHGRAHVQRAYEPLLYGTRHDMAIIDVERVTLPALRRAVAVLRSITENDGVVLFVGTRSDIQPAVRAAVARLGANGFHVSTDRWVPGVLTNAAKLLTSAIQHSLAHTHAPHADRDAPAPNVTKLAAQSYQPDLVVVLNPVDNAHAIREATQCNVPTMAIVDTDVDPRSVTYPIPANDDSPRVAELVLGVLSKAGEDGLRRRAAARDAFEKAQRSMRRR